MQDSYLIIGVTGTPLQLLRNPDLYQALPCSVQAIYKAKGPSMRRLFHYILVSDPVNLDGLDIEEITNELYERIREEYPRRASRLAISVSVYGGSPQDGDTYVRGFKKQLDLMRRYSSSFEFPISWESSFIG